MRMLLAVAASQGIKLTKIDISNAYLNAKVDEDIYMEVPKGVVIDGASEKTCLKLQKSLYGLKQAARNWYLMIQFVIGWKEFSQGYG